ncbi:MAG: SDR family oxidoreductase [Gemmatimonadetes bacterium]|nr:SDR family oxidoreductase [Gemmatimonadota bacterium]
MTPRTTVVTGGTGGLGSEVVRALVARGDRVWIPWISREERDRLAGSLDPEDPVRFVQADVLDAAALAELRAQVETEDGGMDVLCALVGGFTMGPVTETADADWERMAALNARSVFMAVRAFGPLLQRSDRARVVTVAAAGVVRGGGGGMVAYAASKGAVTALTRALAAEWGSAGVSVNAIAPTTIDTAANRAAMPHSDRDGWVAPAELAALVRFLTSDSARVITGNVVLAGR